MRLLFLGYPGIGCRNDFEELQTFIDREPRVNASVVELQKSLLHKILGGSIPSLRGRDFYESRQIWLWNQRLAYWLGPSRKLRSFDMVLVLNPPQALVCTRANMPPYAVTLDSTLHQKRSFFSSTAQDTRLATEKEGAIIRSSDLIIGRSQWTLDAVRSEYGIDDSRLHLMRNGLTLVHTERPTRAAGLPNLVFVGNAWRRKGGPELLRIHQRHFRERAVLHVVSRKAPTRHGLVNVVWHRSASRDEVRREILPRMDIFVLPTEMDMVPWAVLEASEAGIPVVAPRLGALDELIDHGRTGLLYPKGNWDDCVAAIDRLLSDRTLRERLGAEGRRWVTRIADPEKIYPAVIERLIGVSKKARARARARG